MRAFHMLHPMACKPMAAAPATKSCCASHLITGQDDSAKQDAACAQCGVRLVSYSPCNSRIVTEIETAAPVAGGHCDVAFHKHHVSSTTAGTGTTRNPLPPSLPLSGKQGPCQRGGLQHGSRERLAAYSIQLDSIQRPHRQKAVNIVLSQYLGVTTRSMTSLWHMIDQLISSLRS
jgi:hypothetical protein